MGEAAGEAGRTYKSCRTGDDDFRHVSKLLGMSESSDMKGGKVGGRKEET
jgi:hypothetical protein